MAQGLDTLAALGRTVFRNNPIDEICPHPASEPMHVTSLNIYKPLEKWRHIFWNNHIDEICPENRCQKKIMLW